MKLFRSKDRIKSTSVVNSPTLTPSSSTNSTPYATKSSSKKDKSSSQQFSHKATNSLSVSFSNNTATLGDSGDGLYGMTDSKKHSIRIGDTRFYGRMLFRARALYDYPIDGDTLQIEDEEIKLLRFRKNDIVNVYEQDASGWWAGEHNGEKGIFPGSYMKILEEDPEDFTKKAKDMSKDDLVKKITDLERGRDTIYGEAERLKYEFEREKLDMEKKYNENKQRSDTEVALLRKALKEKQETVDSQALKIKQLEYELEESATRLSAKEVEVLTMELEVKDYKKKLPPVVVEHRRSEQQDAKIKRLQEEKEVKATLLRDIDAELSAKRNELQDVVKLRQEIEKGLHEAQAKLFDLEAGEGSALNPSKRTRDLEKQVDLLKKQLGEEVFERKRAESELREMQGSHSGELEALKKDKAKLEQEIKARTEAEGKLSKINLIIEGILKKDDSTLSVVGLKDLLSKMRRAMANLPPEDMSGLGSRGRNSTVSTPTTFK